MNGEHEKRKDYEMKGLEGESTPSSVSPPVCSLTLFFSFPPPLHLRSRAAPFGTRRGGDVKEKNEERLTVYR